MLSSCLAHDLGGVTAYTELVDCYSLAPKQTSRALLAKEMEHFVTKREHLYVSWENP